MTHATFHASRVNRAAERAIEGYGGRVSLGGNTHRLVQIANLARAAFVCEGPDAMMALSVEDYGMFHEYFAD